MIPLLFALSTAQADEAPARESAVLVAPVALIGPRLRAQYRGALSDHTSYMAGVTAGRYAGIISLLAKAADEDFSIKTLGVEGGYTYHLKSFERGSYVTGVGQYQHMSFIVSDLLDSTSQSVSVGAKVGYGIASKGGFTFAIDFGPGYAYSFGELTGKAKGESPGGFTVLGFLGLGYSF